MKFGTKKWIGVTSLDERLCTLLTSHAPLTGFRPAMKAAPSIFKWQMKTLGKLDDLIESGVHER